MLSELSPEELQARADELWWFHRIDLGRGVVTKGHADFTWSVEQLPPVEGRSVLDIGAWDGGYSFIAERHGAARVVALDHYVWGVDLGLRDAYWKQCAEQGVLPDHERDLSDFWDENLGGRRRFEFAHDALRSSVEPLLADFMTLDLDDLGQFDVVLYLGVLYHMPEPLTSLKRVRRVTKEVAAIETVALNIPTYNHERLLQFHPGNELGGDYSNWYVPTTEGLTALCRAAGFSEVEVIVGPDHDTGPDPPTPGPLLRRLKEAIRPAPPEPPAVPHPGHFRTLIHAYV